MSSQLWSPRMISNRSFTIIFLSFLSGIVLILTAKRLDQPAWDTDHLTGRSFRAQHIPAEFVGEAEAPPAPSLQKSQEAGDEEPSSTIADSTDHVPTHSPSSDGGNSPSWRKDRSQAPLVPPTNHDPVCDGFPDTSGILLVMKTGATEAYDRLPVQIMTVLKCLPDFLLFSDLDQHIGGFHVRDSLETVLSEAQEGNPDFDLYRAQKQCLVNQDDCSKILGGADSAGWNLDKYKNIHMADKAYRLRPDYDWYVFVDADTYVSWPNMVYALKKLDPAVEKYLGVPTMIGDRLFAHGGSGYVMSRGAMREFVGKHPGIANSYDVSIQNNCCGDFVFALALYDSLGILVEGFWPLSNGEKPFTTPYGPGSWCHAVGMMHHMNSEEISTFWEFERKRYRTNQKPLIFREVYDEFIGNKLQPVREDWDNAADDWFLIDFDRADYTWEPWRLGRATRNEHKTEPEKFAHISWEHCRVACLEHEYCYMFNWHNQCCSMHRSWKLGKPVKKEEDENMRTISGWNMEKIKAWIEQQGQCGDRVEWPEPVKMAQWKEMASQAAPSKE